tara:strand:- start:3509 stop:4126 length:618 start_codon:yes stop_codon:yes gene_type:complete
VSNSNSWDLVIGSLSENQQETLLGTSLSKQFARLPLWLSHPSNIGGFYGLLVSLALILPYRFAVDDHSGWLSDWALHCALLMVACFFLGLCSTLITAISGRLPVAPPRTILYPMPFIGLALLSINRTDIIAIYPFLSWTLILLPGPLYVHLSWAPRWRLLCMIDDGKNPFEGIEKVEEETKTYAEPNNIDIEIESVVDDFETAEE